MTSSNGQGRIRTYPGDHPLTDAPGLWPADAYESKLRDPADGLSLLLLLLKSSHWVHRRCETVRFHDDRTVARHVSVDFTVPPLAPVLALDGAVPVRLIPLILLRKKTLVHFDLRDDTGATLPLFGLRQAQAITASMLTAWAEILLGGLPLDPDERGQFSRYIGSIAAGTQEDLDDATRDLARGGVVHRLHDDPSFGVVADSMADNFVLMVALRERVGTRRIVKFSYDEPLTLQYKVDAHGRHARRRERLPAALGLHPARIRFPTPAAENCESYHFEVEAPPGVQIVEATMIAGRPHDDEAKPSFDQVSGGFPRANLHVADVPNGSVSQAQIQLTVAREGWLSTATIACVATALVLVMACLSALVTGSSSDPQPVLLAVIGGVASVLVKPQEHRMATRMLSAVRAMTIVAAALPFLATAALVFAPDSAGTGYALGLLAAVAVVLTFAVGKAWHNAGSRRTVISPWEQGRRVRDLGPKAPSYETYAEAESANGYTMPATIVASSEGQRNQTNHNECRWSTSMEHSMETKLEEALRALRTTDSRVLLDP